MVTLQLAISAADAVNDECLRLESERTRAMQKDEKDESNAGRNTANALLEVTFMAA